MKKSQKGSGDSGTILMVFGACCAVSVILIIFSWMGDSLQKRRHEGNRKETTQIERFEPFGYEVVYKRGLNGYSQQ